MMIEQLKSAIASKNSAVVAFSGGVDSATLAFLAHYALGDKAIAVTVKLNSFPERELESAKKLAMEIGIAHRIVYFNELDIPQMAQNGPERCYYCKKEILHLLDELRKELGFEVILEGSNASDASSYRPGKRALDEATGSVYSPFIEFAVTKEEIRQISKLAGLSVFDKASTPCLASRFPYGDILTLALLHRVELAEDFLASMGFTSIRVRDHKGIARIELPTHEFSALLLNREEIVSYFRHIGFDYVTLDVEGFRSGSMDEIL